MAINCYARRRVPGVAADPSRSRRVERAPRCGVLATGDASRVLRRRGCGTSASAASDTSPFVAPAVRARVRRAIGRVSPSDCKRSSDCCGYRDASAAGIAPRARRVRGAWRGSASASVYIPGLIWLKVATGASWSTALSLGLVPFIAGDILKSVVATGLLPARSRLR